jgi:hypothetical protein
VGATGRVVVDRLTEPTSGNLLALHPPAARGGWPRGRRSAGPAPGEAGLPEELDVVVITAPGDVRGWATAALDRGAHVVATAPDPPTARSLLALDAEAAARGRVVVVGAGMAPGLGCVLTRWAAERLDVLEEVHVASFGTGGPACARAHHTALSTLAVDFHEGAWRRRPGGSGRELVWFPEPVGGADCYRCGRADPLLLAAAFPSARRITARVAATRRDRTTAWLPMFYPPHPEGRAGAVRTAVRGWSGGAARTVIVGATARPALAAGAVAATAAAWAAAGRLGEGGAAGLASLLAEPGAFLREVEAAGVRIAEFAGATAEPVP